MVDNSAFVTVGETAQTLIDVAEGRKPGAEYAVLSKGHFSKVLAMVDTCYNPESSRDILQFVFRAYMDTWNEDNIFIGEEVHGIQFLALHALLRRRKRIAMLIHNVKSLKRRVPLAYLRLGQQLNHVLCLSNQSAEELKSLYHIHPSKITVVGSRVDTAFFRPMPEIATEQIVCSAGAVNRDYGTLIDAMGGLGVETKIAADTQWKFSLNSTQDVAASNQLPAFVEMRSWENYVNLRELYARSAVIAVPLQRAMLSGVTVALEGMAMGKPVIMTRNPYVEDFLIDGENGFFVPHGDAGALRARVKQLLDNPKEAEKVGARAREWVCERFNIQRYVDRIMSVWE